MKPGFIAPKGMLDKKPAHGAPCNNCGLCCIASLCPLAQVVFKAGPKGPCPALEMNAGVSTCGLIAHPGRHAPGRTYAVGGAAMSAAARSLIGSGTGCDARMNGEPINEGFYAKLIEHDRRTRSEVRAAKRLWGVPT